MAIACVSAVLHMLYQYLITGKRIYCGPEVKYSYTKKTSTDRTIVLKSTSFVSRQRESVYKVFSLPGKSLTDAQ